MSGLTPNLFDRRFGDLLEIGRARLLSLAPDWTDHNAHDPGITLMELLAWVAEAQIYSLSRLRRDERLAYAALFGLAPSGTVGATGLVWPDRLDPASPVKTYSRSMVLSRDTVIHTMGVENPIFRPVDALLFCPGVVRELVSRHGNGKQVSYTLANERGNVAFLPFGESAGRRDVLSMGFHCRDEHGLFGEDREFARGARLAIGVLAAPPIGGALAGKPAQDHGLPLAVALSSDIERAALRVVSDTTQGFLTTGVLLLDLDEIKSSPRDFTLEFRAPGGFVRPPRILRIEPNVIPMQQGRTITAEVHLATGMPDWYFTLDESGLSFAAGESPVTIEVAEASGLARWQTCDHLSERGPNDKCFEFDIATGRVSFGNGLNGRIPPQGAQVLASYGVSDAQAGEVARNRKWQVAGFQGAFGVNLDPVTGSAPAPDGAEQQRKARQSYRDGHALITAADIETAALALPLLEVARAWIVQPQDKAPRAGVLTLVALKSRPGGTEPEQVPETARWLATIRRRLAPRIPLGTRLTVLAPRYKDFSIRASLETHPRRDPESVEEVVKKDLANRFRLDGRIEGVTPRQPGVPVTRRDLAAWLRGMDGVRSIAGLHVLDASGAEVTEITVPPNGLPRWNVSASEITVKRPGQRSTP
jgi:predicted phage baseplate assembly protein